MVKDTQAMRVVPGDLADGDQAAQDLVDYCARPKCRNRFFRSAGRGRRQEYCSETCRRQADTDYKQAKAMVDQFERLAARSRIDVKAFGRSRDETDVADLLGDEAATAQARAAIDRASAVLRFISDSEDPLAEELRALTAGVVPLIARSEAS